ncbi:MAG: 16S rRNA (guanine(527)-N(7))-methyltransferase RsmG [Bacillota bacterium]
MEKRSILVEGLNRLGIAAEAADIERLIKLKDILLEWNEKINLTAITEEVDVYIKHFLDSATCLLTNKFFEGANVIDVGTGAGFPGVPVKLLKKDIKLTLLDSLNKRITYLNDAAVKLGLESVSMVHARAEEAGADKRYREKYDIALSRAVAAMNVLTEYCMPFVRVGGFFLCQKGPGYADEMNEAANAIKILGGEVEEVKEYILPFSDIKHYIVVIKKISETPTKYPRKPGKPASDPIV